MSVVSNMYDEMSKEKQDLMDSNQEHIVNMLDFAINQLVEIAEDNEIMLVDSGRICQTYDQIFNCLKHCSEKRIKKDY